MVASDHTPHGWIDSIFSFIPQPTARTYTRASTYTRAYIHVYTYIGSCSGVYVHWFLQWCIRTRASSGVYIHWFLQWCIRTLVLAVGCGFLESRFAKSEISKSEISNFEIFKISISKNLEFAVTGAGEGIQNKTHLVYII